MSGKLNTTTFISMRQYQFFCIALKKTISPTLQDSQNTFSIRKSINSNNFLYLFAKRFISTKTIIRDHFFSHNQNISFLCNILFSYLEYNILILFENYFFEIEDLTFEFTNFFKHIHHKQRKINQTKHIQERPFYSNAIGLNDRNSFR